MKILFKITALLFFIFLIPFLPEKSLAATGSFEQTDSMDFNRTSQSATTLANGNVLITGGG